MWLRPSSSGAAPQAAARRATTILAHVAAPIYIRLDDASLNPAESVVGVGFPCMQEFAWNSVGVAPRGPCPRMRVLPALYHGSCVLGSGLQPGGTLRLEVLMPPNMTINCKTVTGVVIPFRVHEGWPIWALMEEVRD